MHEVALVEQLVEHSARRAGSARVLRLHVRHAASIEQETIRQAFSMLTAGGVLESTDLLLESVDDPVSCQCGFAGQAPHENELSPSMVVCPSCGTVVTRAARAELEVLELVLEQPEIGRA